MDKPQGLKMRKFKVEIVKVPTILEMKLYGAKVERETVEIEGYTLTDAKRRNGIQ